MKISDIRIRKTFEEGNLKAIVSITIDDCLAIHEIKIVKGNDRVFVAMPSRKDENGVYRDVIHPITPASREAFEKVILAAYENHLSTQNILDSANISA